MISVMEQSNNIAKCGKDSFGDSKCNLVEHNLRKYCTKCGYVAKVYGEHTATTSFLLIASSSSLPLLQTIDVIRSPFYFGYKGGFSF